MLATPMMRLEGGGNFGKTTVLDVSDEESSTEKVSAEAAMDILADSNMYPLNIL